MGLFNFFKPGEEEKGKSYVKQLYMVALSDGNLHVKENDFILVKAKKRYDFSEDDIHDIKENLHAIKLVDPKNKEERFQLLYDLVWIMIIDDEIHEIEIDLCSRFAMKIGYDPEMVVDLIQTIKNNLDKGISSENTYSNLLSRMN